MENAVRARKLKATAQKPVRRDSVRRSGMWRAMEVMPQWKGLIERAWQDRPDPATKCRLPADPAEVAQTIAFCREAIAQA